MTIISAVLTAALAQTPVAIPGQPPAAAPAQVPVQPAPMPSQSGQQPARPGFLPSPNRTGDSTMASLQGFNIVLLVGEAQSSGPSIEDVPPAARKALADMKEFLPFKNYRVLDSQWTMCCSNPGGSFISGRLQGVTAAHAQNEMRLVPRPYSFRVGVRADSRLYVSFTLTGDAISGRVEPPVAKNSERMTQLEKRLADLRKELDTLDDAILRRTRELNARHPDVETLEVQKSRVQQRIAETMNQLAGELAHPEVDRSNRALIDNSFTMDVGETVVVGTSRLGGDKALIAIVTAARKSGR